MKSHAEYLIRTYETLIERADEQIAKEGEAE
jgi:hypothetical protein